MQPQPKTLLTDFQRTPEPVSDGSTLVELVHIVVRQSQMFCWPIGTQLVVLRGSVQLTETPEWQGETLLRPNVLLQAYASHTLRRDGWVLVLAQQDAVLRVHRPAVAVEQGVWQRLRQTLAACFGLPPQKISN